MRISIPRKIWSCLLFLIVHACNQDNPITVQQHHDPSFEVQFTLQYENISSKHSQSITFAPGVWLVDGQKSLFTPGQPASAALRTLAQTGDFSAFATLLNRLQPVPTHGVWRQTLQPGEQITWSFTARPGQKLSFISVLQEHNHVFLGPEGGQLTLFDQQNEPISGDITSKMRLWAMGLPVNPGKPPASDAGISPQTAIDAEKTQEVIHLLPADQNIPPVSQLLNVRIENDDVHEHSHG